LAVQFLAAGCAVDPEVELDRRVVRIAPARVIQVHNAINPASLGDGRPHSADTKIADRVPDPGPLVVSVRIIIGNILQYTGTATDVDDDAEGIDEIIGLPRLFLDGLYGCG
jgi:hypothetical protein